MGEWLNPAVLKTVIRKYRGFESPSLFQNVVILDKSEFFPTALLLDSFKFLISALKICLAEKVGLTGRDFQENVVASQNKNGEMPERPIGADC
jgi:hypothetical protein